MIFLRIFFYYFNIHTKIKKLIEEGKANNKDKFRKLKFEPESLRKDFFRKIEALE